MKLEPGSFFDLESCSHAGVFHGVRYVWEALGDHLKKYIRSVMRPGIRGKVEPGAHLFGADIQIDEGAVVEAGAYIRGPAIIGQGTEVRHGAYIRGNALVGKGCVVGHATEVKGSIMLDGAKAGHFAYIGDSILGRDVNLGAGTKLANLKVVESAVKLTVDGQAFLTGLRKLGAILGDGTEIGCNAVTNPGTLLGPGCVVYPCAPVKGVHPEGTIIAFKPAFDIRLRKARS